MIEKLIIEKFKKQLGSQYDLYDNDNFERNYTKAIMQSNGFYETRIQQDCFDQNGNKIIGVVQVQSAPYAVTDFEAINTTYTLTLWVPVNFNMVNVKGEYLKDPKFNYELDLKNLREAFNNKTIDFGNGYKGEMTFSEPVPAGSNYDYSGNYKRKVIVVNGKINLTTKGYYGRDYKIELGKMVEDSIDYLIVNNKTSLNFTPQASPIENHEQGELVPEENVEAVKQACLFTVDDSSQDDELNNIFTYLALSGEMSKELYMLKISKRINGEYVLFANYPVYLNVNLIYQYGDSDIGTFTVSCMRSK